MWTPVVRGDDRASAEAASSLFAGTGARQFFDRDLRAARWIHGRVLPGVPALRARRHLQGGIAWDLALLYGPGAVGGLSEAPVLASGAPVVLDRTALLEALARLHSAPERRPP